MSLASRPRIAKTHGSAAYQAFALHGIHGFAHFSVHNHRASTAQRRHRRELWVEAILASLAVVPFALGVARVHARIWADLMASGTIIGAHDLIIGATAIANDMTVATRNDREFQRIEGLRLTRW